MNNRFRENKPISDDQELEELEEEKIIEIEEKESGFFKHLFAEGNVSKEVATDMLPFIIFMALIGMIYIANNHMAVRNIRQIDALSKEVKELSWEYKSLKSDLMFKSKMTEVAKKVDTLGLKELIAPPKKIIIVNK